MEINRKTFKDQKEFAIHGKGCATAIPTPVQISRVDEEVGANKARGRRIEQVTININFIHLTYGSFGHIGATTRGEQIELLNQAYASSNISFVYDEAKTQFINKYEWYFMGHRSRAEREAKRRLSKDPQKNLNFYTGGLQSGLLGWATFPFDLDGDEENDGVVVLDESLPGGNAAPYNQGKTAVHEVGHWIGLYHTFQDGCRGFGDHVNDTVAHDGPNYGKPEEGQPHNSCDGESAAPVRNYMNYVDDEWMTEFTEEQGQRMIEMIKMYRPGLL